LTWRQIARMTWRNDSKAAGRFLMYSQGKHIGKKPALRAHANDLRDIRTICTIVEKMSVVHAPLIEKATALLTKNAELNRAFFEFIQAASKLIE
jgi:hypothetical protein